MSGVRLSGFSGAIPPNLVDQLVEAEKIPIKQMENKKLKEEDTLKLVNDLETKIQEIPKNLGELISTRGFNDLKLVTGDENILSGTVDPEAAPTGEYTIEVLQMAETPGAMTTGFPDKDKTQVGVGYIKFNTPDGEKEIYINGKNSTLEGVANTITRSGTGLRGSVIEDRKDPENPFKLLVTGMSTGNDKNISFPSVYLLDGDQDFSFEQERKAQNAKVKVDGFEIEVPDNKLDKIIPGVTLDIKSAAPGKTVKVFVKEDFEKISGKIKSFVDAYNGALGFIQGQAKLQKSSDGREKLGPLGGDGMLRSIENTLRRIIQNPPQGVMGEIKRLNQVGIEFNRNGTLNFSEEKFNKALNSDPKSMIAFLRGDGFNTGFVPGVRREVSNILNGQFGAISNRKKSLQDRVTRINKQIESKERLIEKKEDMLRKKFADLETKVSQIQNQGNAFKAMGGAGGAGGQ